MSLSCREGDSGSMLKRISCGDRSGRLVVAATPEPYVLTHAESEYGASRFGVLVPERIVFEWRQPFARLKNGQPAFSMSERATFTYGAFKRFDVATEETLKK